MHNVCVECVRFRSLKTFHFNMHNYKEVAKNEVIIEYLR